MRFGATMRRLAPLAALLVPALAGAVPEGVDWAFPGPGPATPPLVTPPGGFSLPGSDRRFAAAQLKDLRHAVDWRPHAHPPAAAAVLDGHAPDALACGFCHLPGGEGRPENAPLAGLPAAYIVEQVKDIAAGTRDVRPDWAPAAGMQHAARAAGDAELADVARYFAGVRYRSHVRVVEAAELPGVRAASYVYRLDPAARPEPLGERIIELPEDFRRFELRDETVGYRAYVPPGSIAAGRALAASGGPAGQPCATCHGPGLTGSAIAPPLAGRSPSYLFRQLHAFAAGTRHGEGAAPMRVIAAPLQVRQMIALAAYAGSRAP